MKKYSLTKTTKEWCGITLFQIKAEISFSSVSKGELGGYIEKEENLSQENNAWVYDNAWVYGDAWVSGNARVYDNAQVSDNAWVFGEARVAGDAWVSGNARVYDNARVSGDARVAGEARVSGDAWVSGDARVAGEARVAAKASFTKGWFIGGSDSDKITNITDKTGSTYWKNQYVLGDYEITPLEEEKSLKGKEVEVKLDGVTYKEIIQ